MLKFPISQIAIMLAFIASLLLFKRNWKHPWVLFPAYLFMALVLECVSFIGLNYKLLRNNQWLYNSFMPIYGLFYFYVFYHIIKLKYTKMLISLLIISFLGGILWEGFSFGFSHFYIKSLIYVSVVQLFLCGLYFYSLFQKEEYFNLLKSPAFWFTTGTLFYMAIVTSTSIFFNELLKLQAKNQIPLRAILVMVGNVIMYGCWIKSFLCINNKQIYTTPSY